MRFRTKVFVASVTAACASLLVAALLISYQVRERQRAAITQRLTDEAELVADLLSASPALEGISLDQAADRLGQHSASRVTLIAEGGAVVGDSTQTETQLARLDNHASRAEVLLARDNGVGVSRRYSETIRTDMLYVAVRTSHPAVRYVRLALPLTEVDAQLAEIRSLTLVALAVAIPVVFLLTWLTSAPLIRRVGEIAAAAERYSAGDLSRPMRDFGSDELGTVARALDGSVHELGRRLQELSRDRARTDAILRGMVEGVVIVDRDGRLQLVNRAAQQMLQADEAALGKRYVEVIRHPDIVSQLGMSLRGEETDTRELTLAREPGRTFLSRAAPVSETGGGGAVLVLHDVTALRHADQIRRDFVANVSHELRTPLTAIRGYVEAVLDDPSGGANTGQFLSIVLRHTSGMERLVNDLLRLARLDAHQEGLERTSCDIGILFQDVLADLAPAIEAKRQHVSVAIGEHGCYAWGDAHKLQEILRNLIENAINYSPQEAAITLRATTAHGTCTITIGDSGPGIPDEHLNRVFERFYRVEKSRARPGGTGLGLAIVKHLVELHGGTVTASNRPEGGAVFTVRVPAVTPQPV
jgi:two-component system phosphate regulon sensor histidine kinase PhoR